MSELSSYDGGWLHAVRSDNAGDIRRATWDDLNCPARIPPLVGAGVPLLQVRSPGCTVATQNLIETHGVGVLFDDLEDLRDRLSDAEGRREAAWGARMEFTFDYHVDRLVALFRRVVDSVW